MESAKFVLLTFCGINVIASLTGDCPARNEYTPLNRDIMGHSGSKKGRKRRLTNRERALIVAMLAVWAGHGEIVKALGRDVKADTIRKYDAANETNRARLARKWVDLFDSTREKFVSDFQDVAISHKSFRLRELQRLFGFGRDKKDIALQLATLRAARDESPPALELDLLASLEYDFIELEPGQEQLYTKDGTPVILSTEKE